MNHIPKEGALRKKQAETGSNLLLAYQRLDQTSSVGIFRLANSTRRCRCLYSMTAAALPFFCRIGSHSRNTDFLV